MAQMVSGVIRFTVTGTNDPFENRNPSLSERKRIKGMTQTLLGKRRGGKGVVSVGSGISSICTRLMRCYR